jgi:hypothetical protein
VTQEEREQVYDGMRPPHQGFTAMGYGVCGLALVCVLFAMVCFWRIFVKAGRGGWKSLVPVYNGAVLLRIVGRPLWWLVLLCIPGVGLVPFLVVLMDLGRVFGRGWLAGLFFPSLAFGKSRYVAPKALAGGAKMAEAASTVEPDAP